MIDAQAVCPRTAGPIGEQGPGGEVVLVSHVVGPDRVLPGLLRSGQLVRDPLGPLLGDPRELVLDAMVYGVRRHA